MESLSGWHVVSKWDVQQVFQKKNILHKFYTNTLQNLPFPVIVENKLS